MTTTTASWPTRAELWLDARGKGAWIAAMILAFIVFWPVGLALLAYMIWSKRMFFSGCRRTHDQHRSWSRHPSPSFRSSGNSAFDAYKSDSLERLEREQEEFEAFLDRLRTSKDKQEFDQYLDDNPWPRDGDPTEAPPPDDPTDYNSIPF